MTLADVFMHQYSCTLYYFLHELTPSQIKFLHRSIGKRLNNERQERVMDYHPANPSDHLAKLKYMLPPDEGVQSRKLPRDLSSFNSFIEGEPPDGDR